jgi:hypothetical protein
MRSFTPHLGFLLKAKTQHATFHSASRRGELARGSWGVHRVPPSDDLTQEAPVLSLLPGGLERSGCAQPGKIVQW